MKEIAKKLYEYALTWTFSEDDEKARKALDESPRKYYFQEATAKEHNEQYALNNVPRKLVKVRGGEVLEVPFWWSGNINRFKKI